MRISLDEIFNQGASPTRMVWWKAHCGPAHHFVFYCPESAEIDRNGQLYTVIHREEKHVRL